MFCKRNKGYRAVYNSSVLIIVNNSPISVLIISILILYRVNKWKETMCMQAIVKFSENTGNIDAVRPMFLEHRNLRS